MTAQFETVVMLMMGTSITCLSNFDVVSNLFKSYKKASLGSRASDKKFNLARSANVSIASNPASRSVSPTFQVRLEYFLIALSRRLRYL